MKIPGLAALLLLSFSTFSQNNLNEGIYLDFQQLVTGNPLGQASADGIDDLRNHSSQYPIRVSSLNRVDTLCERCEIWGFVHSGDLYLSAKKKDDLTSRNRNCVFGKVSLTGTLSFFSILSYKDKSAKDLHYPDGSYIQEVFIRPGISIGGRYKVKTEYKEYLIDFRSGKIYPVSNMVAITFLLQEDEFFKSKRITKKNLHSYVRQFNHRNQSEVFQSLTR